MDRTRDRMRFLVRFFSLGWDRLPAGRVFRPSGDRTTGWKPIPRKITPSQDALVRHSGQRPLYDWNDGPLLGLGVGAALGNAHAFRYDNSAYVVR
jgi:hypothetical protein